MPKSANGTSSIASNAASRSKSTASTTQTRSGNGKMSSSSSQTGGLRNNTPTPSSRAGGGQTKTPTGGLLGMGGTRGTLTNPKGGLLGMGGPRGSFTNPRTGISTPTASGSPYNNPTSINVTPGNGSLKNAMTQRLAVNKMAPQALAPGNRVTDVFGPSYRMDPGIVAQMTKSLQPSAVPAGQKVSSVLGPSYAQDPSLAGRLKGPGVPAGQKVSNVFGPTVRMDPGIIAQMNKSLPANIPLGPTPLTRSVLGEPDVKPYGNDPYGIDNLVSNPQTALNNGLPNINLANKQPKQFTDRVPQGVKPQNYGFQGPQIDLAAQQRASIVNQWRGNQIANNGIHQGLVQNPTQVANVDPAASTWSDDQPVNIVPPGQDAIDRAEWANLQAMNDVGPQPPKQDIFARQNKLQQVASSIMDFLPGGHGGNPPARSEQNGSRPSDGPGVAPSPENPVPTTATAPVNPVAPVAPSPQTHPWLYPQYTQTWANLPQGQGGVYGRA